MSFNNLPAELALIIFSYLGAPFFQQDVSRLTVCKSWFAFAHPILLGAIRQSPLLFTPKRIRRFLNTMSSSDPKYVDVIQSSYLQNLTVEFKDYYYRTKSFGHQVYPSLDPSLLLMSRSRTGYAYGAVPSLAGKTRIDGILDQQDLQELTSFLKSCPKTTSLRVRTIFDPNDAPQPPALHSYTDSNDNHLSFDEYFAIATATANRTGPLPSSAPAPKSRLDCQQVIPLYSSYISNLIRLPHLTSLELDLQWTVFSDMPHFNLCDSIAPLYATLKRLHVRLAYICPRVMRVPDDLKDKKIPLQELIVNTSCEQGVVLCPSLSNGRYGGSCLFGLRSCFPNEEMLKAMRKIRSKMDRPKMVRLLLACSLYRKKVLSCDVLTNEITVLGEDDPWDMDGEAFVAEDKPVA
ncbi:hypothetical protein QBC46DRAFT_42798 [Diplogelasinospora grovesii]|uniref:F-box domain-containing protein n=1 Tax=Diplogelasinospora grovesii TaxID=303347 RepID=A0AAN6MZU3_9PEZI|nr:hypothetical protein QBC46DRAFT_42798 [Diplogelasinospora grovesii]